MLSDETSVRVNNIPAYWEAVRLVKEGLLPAHVDPFSIHKQAEISSHAQVTMLFPLLTFIYHARHR